MLKAAVTFLVMVATSILVFAALGILNWQMALAVVGGSVLGSIAASIGLSPWTRRATSGTPPGPAQ